MAGSFEWAGNELSLGSSVANGLSTVDIAANLSFCVVGGKTGELVCVVGLRGRQGEQPRAEWWCCFV